MTHINILLAAALTISVVTTPASAEPAGQSVQESAHDTTGQIQTPTSEQSLLETFTDVIEENISEALDQRLAEIEKNLISTITDSLKF